MFLYFIHGFYVDFLKQDLDEYVAKLPIYTKVLRLPNREGLVSARLLGAKHATGQVRLRSINLHLIN